MTLTDPHNPAQAAAVPAPRVYRSMAEAVASAPTWPALSRTEERLLQVVWARSLQYGKCFTSQPEIGEALGKYFPGGRAITDRRVRDVVKKLHRQHWLKRQQTLGENDLLKAVTPEERARSHAPPRPPGMALKYGKRKPRKSSSADPGTNVPPNKRNTNTSELGGSPNGSADLPAAVAPLFQPVDLRQAMFALGTASVCEAVQKLFQRGEIVRVRFPARRLPRLLVDVQLGQSGCIQTARLVTPLAGGGSYIVDFSDESLLRLEFFRC